VACCNKVGTFFLKFSNLIGGCGGSKGYAFGEPDLYRYNDAITVPLFPGSTVSNTSLRGSIGTGESATGPEYVHVLLQWCLLSSHAF
jgi:hypothetical protein